MKLLAYKLNGQILGVDKTSWEASEFRGITFSACTDNVVIPLDYADISGLVNWGKFGQDAGLSYVELRTQLQNYNDNPENLTYEEIEILNMYNLYDYFKIYDKINDPSVIIGQHPPVDIDYDLLGYNKKRTFNKGELERVEYYEKFNQTANTFTNKVVEEIRTYYRINQMLSRREMTINWLLSNNTTGYTKTTTKYYTMIEAIQAGETRRSNLISDLKIDVIGLIMMASGATSIQAQFAGTPFLSTYAIEISKYIQGFEQQLKDAIANDVLYSWMNLTIPNTGGITIRQYLIGELSIDYTINNINI